MTRLSPEVPMHPRVLTVIGTRPEAIKMAPVVQALAAEEAIAGRVCVTAQHRQMLDQVLRLFAIRPDYDLDLMRPDQDLADLTAEVLLGLRPVLQDCKPDLVLVQGDTTTTWAAALGAYYQHIPVGHVEAGLRTGNIYAPWPEEMSRPALPAVWPSCTSRLPRRHVLICCTKGWTTAASSSPATPSSTPCWTWYSGCAPTPRSGIV